MACNAGLSNSAGKTTFSVRGCSSLLATNAALIKVLDVLHTQLRSLSQHEFTDSATEVRKKWEAGDDRKVVVLLLLLLLLRRLGLCNTLLRRASSLIFLRPGRLDNGIFCEGSRGFITPARSCRPCSNTNKVS